MDKVEYRAQINPEPNEGFKSKPQEDINQNPEPATS